MEKEALVVCSDKNLSTGITVWDMETGDHLLRIPTCASATHGLICMRNRILVASQAQKHGSVGGGVVFIWHLNKPQTPLRNYSMEAIGPLCGTKDGLYLAGGAPSGNVYVWEISSGRLLKRWHAHKKSVICLTFSCDGSFLVSGSHDGEIRVWPTISLLDFMDYQSQPHFLHSRMEHQSSITGLLMLGSSSSILVSSSLDGTCKIWDFMSGMLVRAHVFSQAITAITLDRDEQLLFSGSIDGKIFVNTLDAGLEDENVLLGEDQCLMTLCGHKGSITTLTFSLSGLFLISASEDCTACLWDVKKWEVIRSYKHQKGRITNLVVVPQSQLFPTTENHRKGSHPFRASPLDKCPQPEYASKGSVAFLPAYCSLEDDQLKDGFRTTDTMNQQILDLEQNRTPEAIQMKVDTSVEKRLWATSMAKEITEINKHLRSRLLDMMQYRLFSSKLDHATKNKKRLKVGTSTPSGDECRECPT